MHLTLSSKGPGHVGNPKKTWMDVLLLDIRPGWRDLFMLVSFSLDLATHQQSQQGIASGRGVRMSMAC